MTPEVFTLRADKTVGERLQRIRDKSRHFNSYPVVDAKKNLVGVTTLRELRQQAAEPPVADLVKEQNTLTVTTSTTIRDAVNQMIEHDFQQVPVVNVTHPKRLLGWLTLNDIARQQNASDN